jgi:hypothetical protein
MVAGTVKWVDRHLAKLALLVACLAMAGGLWSYGSTLRQACEDRNRRDAQILAGVEIIADDLGADPHTIDPLRKALAPRNCEALYPLLPL